MLQQLFLWLGGADPDITEGLRGERMRTAANADGVKRGDLGDGHGAAMAR